MFSKVMISAAALGVAGAASAAPELQVTRDRWLVQAVWDTGFDVGPARESVLFKDAALVSNPTMISESWVSNSEDTGDILNEVATSLDFMSSFDSSSGFSVSTSLTSRIDMVEPLDIFAADAAENFGESVVQVAGQFWFNLTEDATVRIRIDGENMYSDNLFGELNHEASFDGPSLAPTIFGIGDDDANFAPNFDQIVSLAAGEYRFGLTHEVGGDHFEQLEGYEMLSRLDISFEVVPAPGAAALFGLGGLAAARRRR